MLQHQCGDFLRRVAGDRPYLRRLPRDLGSLPVYVSARTDVRLLYWDLTPAAGDLFAIARRCINPGDIVWDIGANLGLFSFAAASKAGPTGSVLAIEPDPRHADLILKSRRRLSSQHASLDVICAAVSKAQGIAELEISARGHARNHLTEVAGNEAGQAVETKSVITITLDWLLEHRPAPKMVKIDVEGAECLVLAGAHRLLSEVRPTIYIEVSDDHIAEVTSILKSYHYLLFDPDSTTQSTLRPIETCNFNTLAIPQESL